MFYVLFFSAPLRLDILLQDEKIARLNQQILELTELNRKCDKQRKRQLRFLQNLINSFKGDNVPLSESVCTQECKKHQVKSKLCNVLCTATSTNGNYKPCSQNWKKQFNRRMRKYDQHNNVRYGSNVKASELKSSWKSNRLSKDTLFTLSKLLGDTEDDFAATSSSSYISKRDVAMDQYGRDYSDPDNYYYPTNSKRYNVRYPYSNSYDYSNYVDSPINVILSSKEEPDRTNFNENNFYAEEIDWENPLPHEPTYVIPDPLGPIEQTLPTDGLNITVPILGELKLRDEEILRTKPIDEILCRQLTCVTNSGFKATVCFLAYDPDIYMAETLGISNATFGKLEPITNTNSNPSV